MAYVKITKSLTEYQGESFTKSLYKKNRTEWSSEEIATYTMTDKDGNEITNGSLTKSTDNMSITIQIGKTITTSLEGKYKILIYLGNTNDSEISDVIAEYNVTYITKKAV